MHFGMKSTLKSNHNHASKQTLKLGHKASQVSLLQCTVSNS